MSERVGEIRHSRDRWEKTRRLARKGTTFVLGPCKRCDHSPDWHRLDDSLNVPPTSPDAEFRCYGYDVEADGPHHEPGDLCDCPDYVENVLTGAAARR